MMNIRKVLPILIIVAIIALFLFSFIFFLKERREGKVVTDKGEYASKGEGRVKIANSFSSSICFSSCFPFYIEEESADGWQRKEYEQCEKDDLAEKCLEKSKVKAFKFVFPELESGNYRLAIPGCLNCKEGDKFSADEWLYSNAFKIK